MATETGENKYAKYGQPSLDFVFTGEKKSLTDRVGNVTVDFTRSSTATYVGSDGLIKSAAVNEARFDHDKDGNGLGLLIEESRTNLALESEDWGNTTYWYSNGNKGGLNQASSKDYFIATNNTTDVLSPDGANNAVKLAGDTNYTSSGYALGRVSIVTKSITLAQNTVYTFSVFIKDPNSVLDSNQIFYIMYGSMFSNTNASAGFDLQNDTVSFGGNISNQSGSIESYSNGWKKLTATFTNTNSGGAPWIFIQESDNFTGPNTFSTNGESFYAFGLQIEEASFGTSYIPTSGSTSTRGADQALLNGTDVTSWYNIPEGTVYSEAMSPIDLTTSRLVWHFRDPGRKEHNADNGFQWYDVGTGYSTNGFTYVAGVSNKQSYAYSHITGSSTRACLNGAFRYDLAVNPSATPSAHTTLSLGSNVGNNIFLNGYIKRFTYWPTRLSDSDLQRLTE